MKKLKYLTTAFAVIISLLLSFDDTFSSIIKLNTIESPLQSDCSDLSHHHHKSLTDHFFQISPVSDSNIGLFADFRLFLMEQSISDPYLFSIWQPPQKS